MKIKPPKKLILIDGNAIIHRAYHALPPLMTKKGELVNAVYGFASTLFTVIEKFQPDYLIATFDLAGPTFRHQEFEEYKAHRVKGDQELYDQIPRVKELVRAMNIPIYEKEGFEADDIIGTLSKKADELKEDIETIIVTGDLDALQLVSEKTTVYTMRRGLSDSVLYDAEKVRERYSLTPAQLIDFKGLRGDASDNIPGVKGIGEKTAIDLLSRFQTLEGVYEHIAELKGAVKDKLERDKVMALKSKRLATIERSVPLELDLEAAKTHDFDREKLVKFFQELNFFSLIKRIPGQSAMHAGKQGAMNDKSEGISELKCEIMSEKNIKEIEKILDKQKEIAIKIQAAGEKILDRELRGLAIGWESGRSVYVPYEEKYYPFIRKILADESIVKVGYDLKNELEVLTRSGLALKGKLFDVMLSAYVLNPGGKIELEKLVLEELGEELPGENKRGQLGLMIETQEDAANKLCLQADYIWKLKGIFQEKIETISATQKAERTLQLVLDQMETPLIEVLSHMELAGIHLNKVIFQGISAGITKKIENLEKSIYELSGEGFNINSPKQLAEVLFSRMNLPTANIKKGKTGYSTASSELKKLESEHKIIAKIEDYRELFKLKTTYLDALPLLIESDGRIHSKFNQAVAATGRLSSSDPNLQNIPIRTEIGQVMRTAFEAEKGWKLIAADYSQIDLRVVAHVSQDKKMIELFHAGEDIHRATAAEINKVTLSQVTDTMRRRAKELNFGVIYGMGTFGFSERTGISRDDAKKFIDAYFEKFSGVAKYMKNTRESVKKLGYVETETGRRRYIPEINSPNFQVASSAERMAINMPIQGLSADIVKLAMIKVYDEFIGRSSASLNQNDQKRPIFKAGDVKMVLQVHDEIILEVKENLAEEVSKKIKEIMEHVYTLSVPLVVDVKIGDNWGEL